MELAGKIVQVLDIVTGEGKNGQWKKQDFILELPGQYQRKVCITLFGDKIEQFNVQAGHRITSYNVCYTKLLRIELLNFIPKKSYANFSLILAG